MKKYPHIYLNGSRAGMIEEHDVRFMKGGRIRNDIRFRIYDKIQTVTERYRTFAVRAKKHDVYCAPVWIEQNEDPILYGLISESQQGTKFAIRVAETELVQRIMYDHYVKRIAEKHPDYKDADEVPWQMLKGRDYII